MALTDPVRTSTIEDFIELGENDEITYNNMALFTRDLTNGAFIYSFENVIGNYLDELREAAVECTVTDSEWIEYRYNPYRLSNTLYGTTQLYYVILFMNNMISIKDFNLNSRKILLLGKTELNRFIDMIMSAESNRIKLNREYIEEEKSGSSS